MSSQRILLIGGVGVVRGRIKDAGQVMREICDDFEPLLIESNFVSEAPFKTVSLIIRFGENNGGAPIFEPINQRHKELPASIELSIAELRPLDRGALKNAFIKATIEVLEAVVKKYSLSANALCKLKNV